MEPLSFRIPKQQPPGERAFDTRPPAVKRWVTELPMGNTGEAARRLYTAIKEVNALTIPVGDRLGMMEALAAPWIRYWPHSSATMSAVTSRSREKHCGSRNLLISCWLRW